MKFEESVEALHQPEAAGIIVLHESPTGWEALILITDEGPDLTKGKIDGGETPLEAAVRETREEAGITQLDFRWGTQALFVGGTTVMYIAVTTQEPDIIPNPETGILEHVGWQWVPLTELERVLAESYLVPTGSWARSIVMGPPLR
jgi:bis(5'-nucleosidyl)-tetraphosphatase